MSINTILICIICLLTSLIGSCQSATNGAQDSSSHRLITGKLTNGLTYYLQKAAGTSIEFKFVVNAGYHEENKKQTELAHLIEHLAFRESQHFPGGIRNYLLGAGAQCGASTGFNSTIYSISIPKDNPNWMDCLKIIKDWAQNLIFVENSIKSEAETVTEEIRLSQINVESRMSKKLIQSYAPSETTKRIHGQDRASGLLKYDESDVQKFYHDWYRPDLEAIIIVGDFETSGMEKKIAESFSDLKSPHPAPQKKKLKPYVLTDKNRFEIVTDPQKKQVDVMLFYQKTKSDQDTLDRLYKKLNYALYNEMIRHRLSTVSQSEATLFSNIYSTLTENEMFSPLGIDGLSLSFTLLDSVGIETAFKTAIIELERINQHGFSPKELEKAIKNIVANSSSQNIQDPKRLTSIYINHFTNKTPLSSENSVEKSRRYLQDISIEDFNRFIRSWITDKNRLIVILANDDIKEKLPSANKINEWINAIHNQNVPNAVYHDLDSSNFSLFGEGEPVLSPIKYTIVEDKNSGISRIQLPNGVEIYLRPVAEKSGIAPYIAIHGISRGGASGYAANDFPFAAASIVKNNGFEKITAREINTIMDEREVYVYPYISSHFEGIVGGGKADQLESILQLMYLYLKPPHKEHAAFERWKQQKIKQLKKTVSPQTILDSMSGYSARELNSSNINDVSENRAYEIYSERLSTHSDFTFFISGSFDMSQILPLVTKYLGSLLTPSKSQKKITIPPDSSLFQITSKNIDITTGSINSKIELFFNGKYEYNSQNNILLTSIKEILSISLFHRLREVEGGVYYCNTNLVTSPLEGGRYSIRVSFECNPDNIDRLILAVKDEIVKLKQLGPLPDVFSTAKKIQAEKLEAAWNNPNNWMTYFITQFQNDQDVYEISTWAEILDKIDEKEVKAGAAKWLRENQLIKFNFQ